MEFSKLAAIFAAGPLLAAGQLASAENILRFRVSEPPSKIEAADATQAAAAQSLHPAGYAVTFVPVAPDSDPVETAIRPVPSAPDAHAMPPATGYFILENIGHGPHYPDDPWAGYAEEKLSARVIGHRWSLLHWLDRQLQAFDLFGIFTLRKPSACCCSDLAAAPAQEAAPQPIPDPAAEMPQKAAPPRNVLPQRTTRQSSSAQRPATPFALKIRTKSTVARR